MAKNIVIVGAGPAGLTAASELVKSTPRVTILEQDEAYVGGISRTVQYNGFRFDIGGHRFFSKNTEIMDWWRNRLPSDFIKVPRQSRILYGKKFYDYPLRPLNAVKNLGLINSALCVSSYGWSRVFPRKPEDTFEDWVSNRFGRKLFKTFFKTYTEKVWGMPCSEISADWSSQRIKGLSLKDAILHAFKGRQGNRSIKTLIDEFQYPRLGPGMMWEKTRDDVVKAGARVYMGKKVSAIHRDGNRVVAVSTKDHGGLVERWEGDEFILSMPLRDTVLNVNPALPSDALNAAKQLTYRDFITVALVLRGENFFPDNWIYIHDPDVRVGRVQNFNNWSPQMVPTSGVTCLGLEYFCNVGDDFWCRSDEELIQIGRREAAQIGLISPESVIDAAVARIEKAYPVYDRNYQQNVQTIRTTLGSITNLQVVGRNGMHKYNNQDHSMMTGLLAARNLSGERNDLWMVNTDAEYHEDGSKKG